jgi:hypothetical protein
MNRERSGIERIGIGFRKGRGSRRASWTINANTDGHAGVLYSSRRRRGMRLSSILGELLSAARFDVQMQFGARFIQRRRTLRVDEDGLPIEKKMRRNVNTQSKGNR